MKVQLADITTTAFTQTSHTLLKIKRLLDAAQCSKVTSNHTSSMKEIIIALFSVKENAEKAIQQLHKEAGIDASDISYLYKTIDGVEMEVDADSIINDTPGEGATKGAVIGGSIGAIAGIATVVGAIPVIGPIFAAGPLVTALGIGAGAVGTTAAGAVTGAAAGGVIGALVAWGAPEQVAKTYEERVLSGDILVAVHTEKPEEARVIMEENHAFKVNQYAVSV